MSRLRLVGTHVLVVGIVGLTACDRKPLQPTPVVETASVDARSPSAPAGFYTFAFLNSAGEEVTSLPYGPYPVSSVRVMVHVEDANHQPALTGTVLFEVCLYKTTGKAAPSSACAAGTARWDRWTRVDVYPITTSPYVGSAWAGIDVVLKPCVMGWRATYSGNQTIAGAKLGPADITWTAQ